MSRKYAHIELVGELGVVGSSSDVLLPALNLVTVVNSILMSLDDSTVAHEGRVGGKCGQLGLLIGSLSFEGINGSLVIVELVGKLSVIGSKLDLVGEFGNLLALGLDTGSAILALGRDGSGEEEGDEDVGQLHFYGSGWFG